MNTAIVVLTVLLASVAILTVVAFRRGWLGMAPQHPETKGHFILMRKKDASPTDKKQS
jgi:hypothetical protein